MIKNQKVQLNPTNSSHLKKIDTAAAQSFLSCDEASSSGKIRGQGKAKDTAATLVFRDDDNFADVFNHTVFTSEPISRDDLFMDDTKEIAMLRVTGDTHTALAEYRDIVKKLKKDQDVAILGIEHQSEQSFQMPFRVMEMDFLSYARQVRVIMERNKKVMKAGKDSKEDSDLNATQPEGFIAASESVLPDWSLYPRPTNSEYLDRFYQNDQIAPCITLVIYWGAEPWLGPRGLSEMFGKNSMASYAKDYPMYLLEVRQIPDTELASYGKELRAVFGFVKYARDKLSLQKFLTQNEADFSELSGIVLDAIAELTHSPELKKLRSTQFAIEMEGGNYNMCQALREWIEDERREGIEEGRKEGIKEGIKEERINTERERRRADAAEQELRILKAQFGLV